VMTAQLCYKLYRHCGYCVPVNWEFERYNHFPAQCFVN
jgi:hypothetical protein